MIARAPWGPLLRATTIGALLVLALTYPTIPRATSVGRLDSNDGRFSIWNVAWIDHALLTDPRHLIDANIFWPHTGTLAYSELNLVAGLFGLPWYAATGSALAALNGSVFVALVLAFVCMAMFIRRLTGSESAGLVSAVGFTFSPFVGARTGHIQLLMIFAFPLLFMAYHRLWERPSIGRGVALGAALAIAALACGYYGIFGGLALGLVGLCLAQRSKSYWLALATAMATTAVLIYPVYRAFANARALSGAPALVRTADEAREWSANWSSYLASSAIAHEWWLPYLGAWKSWVDVLFPGIGLLALAALGTRAMMRSRQHRRLMWTYLALAAVAFWASFGPDAGLYSLLNTAVPGMSLLRAPARLGIVVTFALAVLAGFGAEWLGRQRRWLPIALVVALTFELSMKTDQWGWPSWPLRNEPPVSAAYRKLAELPPGVLVEYQFPYEYSNFHNHATAMYLSTYHWKPLVNGYSDLIPPDFREIALPINYFPDPASFAIMKARNVRYVLWHIDYYEGAGRNVIVKRLEQYADYVRPVLKTDDVWLYEIVKWPAGV